ncbi:hypothetical protein BGZ70_004417 [Mortierella alpina]|uniref:CCHC-type domain-containing protein n=1 Tax=Mortierella alpina TaxID=64518 RepID=A0A9P6IQV8_MORAP|nr:hypothetical protein BGZ70_004417 [Mortierella alpina]
MHPWQQEALSPSSGPGRGIRSIRTSLIDPVHSINSYPTSTPGYHDQVVTNEVASVTPLIVNGVADPPMSSSVNYIVTRFAVQCFFFRNDTRNFEETLEFAEEFVEEYDMGAVIKIEVPRFRYGRRQAYRNEFIFYTKSTRAADSRIPRSRKFPSHQDIPVMIGWIGAPAFCTYCKKDGHFNEDCVERLSKICNSCHAPGHVSTLCSRFGERDRKAARKRAEKDLTATPAATLPANTITHSTQTTTIRPPSAGLSDLSMNSWDEVTESEDEEEESESEDEEESEPEDEEESESEQDADSTEDVDMTETLDAPTMTQTPSSPAPIDTSISKPVSSRQTERNTPASPSTNKAKNASTTRTHTNPSPSITTPVSSSSALPEKKKASVPPDSGPRRSTRVNKGVLSRHGD